jgi:leader peptidase (prepilin peptidase)/N-methyltransferase
VELAVGALWTVPAWHLFREFPDPDLPILSVCDDLLLAFAGMLFYWLVVALAVLDAEHLWLPDWITLPGAALGCLFSPLHAMLVALSPLKDAKQTMGHAVTWALLSNLFNIAVAAGFVLLLRGVYWLIRRREGIGLGDAKLMAFFAAWLGLQSSLLAFGLGVMLGAVVAIFLLIGLSARPNSERWATSKLPLGTFICIGGVISALWGKPIIEAYLRLARF